MQSVLKVPVVLVAESSVLRIAPMAIQGLRANLPESSITLVVPDGQRRAFVQECPDCSVIGELELLPNWPLQRVAEFLGPFAGRAGWYLQQMLKLEFARTVDAPWCVAWDADTVLLRKLELFKGGRVAFASSRERHNPYFDTYRRLTGLRPILPHSAIAQYMVLHAHVVRAFCGEIGRRAGVDWVEAILKALPLVNASEFSEYESYANYFAYANRQGFAVTHDPWFRYGSAILDPCKASYSKVSSIFHRYAYVSFERHQLARWKRWAVNMLFLFGHSNALLRSK